MTSRNECRTRLTSDGNPAVPCRSACYRIAALALTILCACVVASAQDGAGTPAAGVPSPLPVSVLPNPLFRFDLNVKPAFAGDAGSVDPAGAVATTTLRQGTDGVFTLTLDEAQEAAAGGGNPLVRLGELGVEAAKQHRLGVQGLYFPNVSTMVENLHLNKQTGQVLSLPRFGVAVPVNIFGKDNTIFNVVAAQPITPLFSVRQLVKIARADENIARAKAGRSVAETAMNVERNYFELLVAQMELAGAEADARKVQAKWVTASIAATPVMTAEQAQETLGAEKAVLLASSKVAELTASLNQMIGLPADARLDLVEPGPFVDNVSVTDVAQTATGNPEVIEAEQTAVKAHAGLALAKLQYVPTVAIVAGYAKQNLVAHTLLPNDFSYIGFVATFTLFDGLKREHGVKEVKAQAEMADLAVQLTKAKVGAKVTSAVLELDRSRQLYQLARRMVSSTQSVNVTYRPDDPDVESARAKMKAELFRAELEYRQAYARLKALTGPQ